MRLDRRCFGQDSFWLTKEAISFNAMRILNSFGVRSLFSNFLYSIKELTRATSNRSKNNEQIKKQTEIKSKLRSSIKLIRWLLLIHHVNSTHFAVVQRNAIWAIYRNLRWRTLQSSLHGQYKCYFFKMASSSIMASSCHTIWYGLCGGKIYTGNPGLISLSFFICGMLILSKGAVPWRMAIIMQHLN